MLNFFKTDRFYLLYPLSFACGIGLYFYLDFEPSLLLPVSVIILSVVLFFCASKGRMLALLSMVAVSGFLYASFRAKISEHDVIDAPLKFAALTGRVDRIVGKNIKGYTVILDDVVFASGKTLSAKLRLKIRTDKKIEYNDKISGNFDLYPPSLPQSYYDGSFAMEMWFSRIGAGGYNVGVISVEKNKVTFNTSYFQSVLSKKVFSFIDANMKSEREKTVAFALVLGEKGYIPNYLKTAYQNGGIAHLLAVSGTHMSLVVILIFCFVRFMLAMIPQIALRTDIKKISAVIAMIGATLYLFISGMMIPAVRAYITVMVVMSAILFERKAVSLRNTAIAMVIIFLINPVYLTSASFLMSFMAVIMIVGVYERCEMPFIQAMGKAGVLKKTVILVAAMLITDIAATLATTPLCMYYFNRVPLYGIIGNIVAAPIFSFFVMPLLIFAVTFNSPWLLILAGKGIAVINDWALFVSSKGGVVYNRAMMTEWLVIAIFALLSFIMVKGKVKVIPLFFYAISLLSVYYTPIPDFMIDETGKLFAFKNETGILRFNQVTAKKKVRERWMQKAGFIPAMTENEKNENITFLKELCSRSVCQKDGFAVVLDDTDCKLFTFAVNLGNFSCVSDVGGKVIDRKDLLLNGTYSVFKKKDGRYLIKTAKERVGCRKWTRPWCRY